MCKIERKILVGEEYIFFLRFTDGAEDESDELTDLPRYNGRKCIVMRKCEAKDYIGLDVDFDAIMDKGGLYEVRFDDNSEFDVYGNELEEVSSCVEITKEGDAP